MYDTCTFSLVVCVHATAIYGAETLVVSSPYVMVVTRPLPSLSRSRWLCESESRTKSLFLSLSVCLPRNASRVFARTYYPSQFFFVCVIAIFFSLFSSLCVLFVHSFGHPPSLLPRLLLSFLPFFLRILHVFLSFSFAERNVYIRESTYSLCRSDDHDWCIGVRFLERERDFY